MRVIVLHDLANFSLQLLSILIIVIDKHAFTSIHNGILNWNFLIVGLGKAKKQKKVFSFAPLKKICLLCVLLADKERND